MTDIDRYKERRRKRLAQKNGLSEKRDAVEEFKERRNDRLEARMDAGVGWAYGLAESKGIDTSGMSPKEVFEALKEKGGVPKAKNAVKGKGMKGEASTGYINAAKASHDHTIGGYKRKNIKNFKNGYGTTNVDKRDRESVYGATMKANTNENGEWTAEREALHSKIIDNTFNGVKKPKGKPVTTFMGGGPASGKSYVVKKEGGRLGLPSKDERVLVDPDECKKPLPEYDEDNPGPVHEESSALAKRIAKIAQENGYNALVDGTGDTSVEKMRKKIKQARDAGHTVNGVYVFKPVEKAIIDNFARDRTVDPKMLVETHQTISKMFPEIAGDFDDIKLYANMKFGEPPVLIARGGKGRELEIVNKDLYKQFLANADYQFNPSRVEELSKLPEAQKRKKEEHKS